MTASGGSTRCSCTWVISTPACSSSRSFCSNARVSSAICWRLSDIAAWIGVRLMTSRSAPSAAILTASSGLSTLNRNWPGSRIFQNTVQSASTMFSSPVSICPPRLDWPSPVAPEAPTPSWIWLTWVTLGSSTVSIG